MLSHCLIDHICLSVFENIYILIIVLLCLFINFLYFLKFILSIFLEDHIGNKWAIVCFNESILGKYYIYAYFVICLCIESKFVFFLCIIMFYQINSHKINLLLSLK